MEMKTYSKISRLKIMIEYLTKKYSPKCYFCGKDMDYKVFFPKYKMKDNWTIHHIDENRKNNNIENLVLCHRGCHRKYHKNKFTK